ncbi:MAG TPA: dienelactone hydrolase family protein [Xanthobacteraceae bacterium]|jgi:dienelactone hydrolase
MRLLIATLALALGANAAGAQERVSFLSLDGVTTLQAHLIRPKAEGRRPALVFLHGCSGLLRPRGGMFPLYPDWGRRLAAKGYVILMVDSAASRGFGETCTASPARITVARNRPLDAYAALKYLQAQPFVRPDRVGLIGWSQGGATVLRSIAARSIARPVPLAHDFKAAVALYPGACAEHWHTRPFVNAEPNSWTTKIPLLVLFGEQDNWTPIKPCEEFIAGTKARGAPVEFKRYPFALHGFDAPGQLRLALPAYRLADGTVPEVGTDGDARADALLRVPEFFGRYLGN